MKLQRHQTYLASRKLYDDICRLARLRVQRHALALEQRRLEESICRSMAPATEIVDLTFLGQQHEATEAERREMFVARVDAIGRLTVHPPYVSARFRPETA